MPTIEKDGQIIAAIQPHMLEDWLADNDLKEDDVTIQWSEAEQKAKKRARIADDAGDTLSLLGTTSDGAHLLLIHMARFLTAVKTAPNLAAVKAAATPFADLMEDRIWQRSMPILRNRQAALRRQAGRRSGSTPGDRNPRDGRRAGVRGGVALSKEPDREGASKVAVRSTRGRPDPSCNVTRRVP